MRGLPRSRLWKELPRSRSTKELPIVRWMKVCQSSQQVRPAMVSIASKTAEERKVGNDVRHTSPKIHNWRSKKV